MQITRTHTFEHPFEECRDMFLDPASHVAKFEAMGHRDVEVLETERSETSIRIVIRRQVDVEVPSFARRVLHPTNTVRSTDVWTEQADGSFAGTFELDAPGVPIEVVGTTSLRAAGEVTEYIIGVELTVRVPLIGGRIASVASGMIERQLTEEFELGDAWLASSDRGSVHPE